jgi:23S rRNA (cytidine1920-2'-O)/16S rRNA (cytidine1409-2'-O)-methyltransferase
VPKKVEKIRLDEWLVQKGLLESRSKAKALILAGKVYDKTQRLDKPGQIISKDAEIRLKEPPRFVSRGGEKLKGFIDQFSIEFTGQPILDIGASTGGFTDCALQSGAVHATCVDVGRAQLHNKLRQDPRVKNIEKLNARYLKAGDLPYDEYPKIVMDLSFISLKKILPAVWEFLANEGQLIALIKPQFEAEKLEVDAGKGIIRDEAIQERILNDIMEFSKNELADSEVIGQMTSPIKGTDGNKEFLLGLIKHSKLDSED